MFEGLEQVLTNLPLPWLICVLSWLASGYICRELWKRGNDLQDKNLADVKESAEKYAALSDKINDTLDAFIALYRGRNKRVR